MMTDAKVTPSRSLRLGEIVRDARSNKRDGI
jgi:hypothetical protein